MRVFAATLGTETNTFSPIPTSYESFAARGLYRAGEHPDHPTLFTGPLWAARERAKTRNWHVIEGLCAFAQPAGPTVRAAYERLRDELLADLKAALPVDMVLLGLHGAMVAEGYEDCEGDLLARVRALVGDKTVIGAELDPHCHLTEAMTRHADALICFKEYPHTDFLERARELVDLCAAAADGRVKPVMSVYDCRMISTYHTPAEPMRSYVDRLKALEGKDGVLSVSVAHGFPWGDVPDQGTRILVVTDGRRAAGDALAEKLGRELIGLRGRTFPAYLGLAEALDRAAAAPAGPIVLADSADNPGGGAPGDSTFVLAELFRRAMREACLGPLYDPQAVAFCHAVGAGARLPLRIGGKTSPVSGAPLDVEAEVLHVARDASQAFGKARAPMGDAATIRVRGVDIVLVGERCQATGTDLFTAQGVDPAAKRYIVVKSSQHFHAAFAPLAKEVLYIGGPGAIDTDFAALPFRRTARPKWPFDADPWSPR
jgi:microcystin degradation protein MlrC